MGEALPDRGVGGVVHDEVAGFQHVRRLDALVGCVGGPHGGVSVEEEEVSGVVKLKDGIFSDGGVSIYICR